MLDAVLDTHGMSFTNSSLVRGTASIPTAQAHTWGTGLWVAGEAVANTYCFRTAGTNGTSITVAAQDPSVGCTVGWRVGRGKVRGQKWIGCIAFGGTAGTASPGHSTKAAFFHQPTTGVSYALTPTLPCPYTGALVHQPTPGVPCPHPRTAVILPASCAADHLPL